MELVSYTIVQSHGDMNCTSLYNSHKRLGFGFHFFYNKKGEPSKSGIEKIYLQTVFIHVSISISFSLIVSSDCKHITGDTRDYGTSIIIWNKSKPKVSRDNKTNNCQLISTWEAVVSISAELALIPAEIK